MSEMWKSCRHLGKLLTLIFVLACCLSLATSMSIAAEEEGDDVTTEDVGDTGTTDDPADDTDESYFANPAQAAKAANLAEASALSDDEVAQLEADLEAAEAAGDEDLAAEIADKLNNASGVSTDEISDMRASGMGWGEIAHELGVHPSVLGLGHKKGYTEQEMMEATARNTKTGYAKGHGMGLDTERSGFGKASAQGLGKSKGASKAGAADMGGGKGKGHGGNSGGGKGGGKGGGNGGGNGNGNGKK